MPPGKIETEHQNTDMKAIELEYDIEPKRRNHGAANPHLLPIFTRNTDRYLEHLRYLSQIREDFYGIPVLADQSDPLLPNWENGFLPALDIAALHAFLRRLNPRRYFEIGSGNSTKIARRAIRMHGLQTAITSLDPHPRAEIDQICDRVVRMRLEDFDSQEFKQLEAGDVLFFDGSHYAHMNSDVVVFFLEVLPILRPGVLVQIHDICLPCDYYDDWADRCYSEQYLLACALLYGAERFHIELPNAFVSSSSVFARALGEFWDDGPLQGLSQKHGCSFWFRMA